MPVLDKSVIIEVLVQNILFIKGGIMAVKLKRAYEAPSASDGQRILVDRLWPRGVTKEKAKIDTWLKDISPSTELRQWFDHDPTKWAEFQTRFTKELAGNDAVAELRELIKKPSTLVYSAKDEEHNNALVIKKFIES